MNALSNLKILDFSTLLPGPFATMTLADMGADVIKISSPSKHDLVIDDGPKIDGRTPNLLWLNRNKKTLALNLKTKEGIEIVKELVKEYDIVVEQFRPGVMKKLGLGYEDLKAINPNIIYCSISGYGQTGPYKDRPSHDINYLARSGMMEFSGSKAEGPKLYGMQIGDLAGGAQNACIAILAAVNYRSVTGKGQYIDISMCDSLTPYNSMAGTEALATGVLPTREGDLLNGGSIYDFYRTKDDRFLSIGALEPKFYSAFCEVLGIESESATDIAAKEVVKEKIASKTLNEWKEIFKDVEACVEPVLNINELMEDEQIKERELIVELDVAGKKVKQFANPIKFSETKQEYKFAGKKIGSDNREILKSLGYDDKKIEELECKDVFK